MSKVINFKKAQELNELKHLLSNFKNAYERIDEEFINLMSKKVTEYNVTEAYLFTSIDHIHTINYDGSEIEIVEYKNVTYVINNLGDNEYEYIGKFSDMFKVFIDYLTE